MSGVVLSLVAVVVLAMAIVEAEAIQVDIYSGYTDLGEGFDSWAGPLIPVSSGRFFQPMSSSPRTRVTTGIPSD